MKRRLLLAALFAALLCAAGAAAFWSGEPSAPVGDGDKLVIYASERDTLMDAVIPLFEEKYGIQIHLVQGETGELLDRLREEGASPEADVVMGISLADVLDSQALFQEYISVNDKYLMEPYRNSTGLATSYVLNGNCLVVNRTLARELSITDYDDLLDPALAQKVALADPLTSSTGFDQLVNLLQAKGGYDDPKAWEFVRAMLKQLGGHVQDRSEQVYTGVARGTFLVGLSREDACAGLQREGADVDVIYPAQGSLFSPRVAALVKNAAHGEYARYFLDFITGKDMQDIFGTLLTSRPVRRDAKNSQFLTDLEEIPAVTVDAQELALHKEEILARYQQIKREITEDE